MQTFVDVETLHFDLHTGSSIFTPEVRYTHRKYYVVQCFADDNKCSQTLNRLLWVCQK